MSTSNTHCKNTNGCKGRNTYMSTFTTYPLLQKDDRTSKTVNMAPFKNVCMNLINESI